MKKRILSMLLAVVMVVTALPLLVLPSLAADPEITYPATTAADYNALYVKNGLVLQYDFFDSNAHWGGVYSDGTRLTMEDAQMHMGTETLAPYKIYTNSTATVTAATKLGINGMGNSAGSEAEQKTYTDKYSLRPTVGNGYLELQRGYVGGGVSNSFGAWGRSANSYMMTVDFINAANTYTLTTQYVTAITDVNPDATLPHLYLGGVSLLFGTDEGGNYFLEKFYDGSAYSSTAAIPIEQTASVNTFASGEIVDLTTTVSQTTDAADATTAQPGLYAAYVNGTAAYYNDQVAFTKLATDRPVNYHALWCGRYAANTYAIRFYNTVLTEEDIAQNHFADLAKWFRLDISSYNEYSSLLTEEQMHAALAKFRDFNFASDRAEVQALADTVFEAAVFDDDYFAGFEGAVDATVLAVAKKFQLKIDVLAMLPAAQLPTTYALLQGYDLTDDTLTRDTVMAAYNAAVEADVLGAVEESVLTAEGYNALYEKSGLVLQYDFFDSNEYWGGAYSDGTRLVMEDTNMHTGTASLSPFRVYANSKSGFNDTVKIGINGMGSNAGQRPTVGNGYIDFVQHSLSDNNGVGSWGRSGDNYTYMMKVDFINDANTYTLTTQYVTAISSINDGTRSQMLLGGLGVWMKQDNNGNIYLNQITEGFTATNPIPINQNASTHSFAPGQVVDFTSTISQPTDAADTTVAQPGTYAAYINGDAAFYSDEVAFTTAATSRPVGYLFLWSGRYAAHTYAIRYYSVELTPEVIAQNHFADVAKWYKLGLVGFDSLDDSAKATLYEAFADVTVDDPRYTRVEVQAMYLDAISIVPYETIKAAHPEKADFIDLAAAYSLPLDTLTAVLESRRDMSYVYSNITAETLAETDDPAATFAAAYDYAYSYYAYIDGTDDTHDAFVAAAAEAGVSIEALMALPKAERSAAYALDYESLKADKAAFQAAVDEAVEAAMEKYADYTLPTVTEDIYNTLYVQDGLLYALDYFFANQYWNVSNPMPVAPYLLEEYDTEEERWDIVYDGEGIETSRTMKAAYSTAISNYYNGAAGHSLRVWNQAIPWYMNGVNVWNSTTSSLKTDEEARKNATPPFYLSDGYIQFIRGLSSNTYLNYTGGPINKAGTVTAQYVMAPANNGTYAFPGDFEPQSDRDYWVLFRGISLKITANNSDTWKLTPSSYSSISYTLPEIAVPFSKTDVGTFTLESTVPSAAADGGHVKVQYNAETLLDSAVTYGGSINYNTLFNFSNSTTAGLYALRYYSGSLTETEVAQNHFADVAKYFKLDIATFIDMSEKDKSTFYLAFADLGITLNGSTREEAQEAYEAAIFEACYRPYMSLNAEVDKAIVLAAENGVSIGTVTVLPTDMIVAICTKINEEFDVAYACDSAVLAYRLAELVKEQLGGVALKEYSQAEYNELYAQKEHMVVWFDFFSSTKDLNDTIDANADFNNGSAFAINPADAPSIFRAGKLTLSAPYANKEEVTGQRSFEDGYFVMSSSDKFPNIAPSPDSRYYETALYYSDYTFEFVLSDMEGHNQNLQLDGMRLAVGNLSGGLRVSAITANGPRFSSSSGEYDTISAASFTVSTAETTGSDNYNAGSVANGHTIALRYDKDFTNPHAAYYKVTQNENGKYVNDNRVMITRAEAEELLGKTGEEFDTAMAVPTTVSSDYKKNFSSFVTAADGTTIVYAYLFSASGSINVSINGNEHITNPDAHYGVGAGFFSNSIGSGVNMNVYSIRRYDIILTDKELMQNHFVDLCKYYGLDITAYLQMNDSDRAAIHLAMKDYKLKANENEVKAAYAALIKSMHYDVLKANYDEAYASFFDKAAAAMLDLTPILSRPVSLHTFAMDAFDELEIGADPLVMQKVLNDKIAEVYANKTAEEWALELIEFDGYQVRLNVGADAMPGIRGNFVINEEVLEALEALGYTVSFGASITGNESAPLTVYNGSEYVGKTYNRMNAGASELCFTYTTLFDEESLRNKEHFDTAVAYKYWITVEKTGEEPVTFTYDCESEKFGDTVSAAEVYTYFRSEGNYATDAMVTEVVGASLEKTLVDITIHGKNIAAYTLVYDDIYTEEMAIAIADAIEELTGTRLTIVATGALNTPTLDDPAIWLMSPLSSTSEAAAFSGRDFVWYSEHRSGSFGIVAIDLSKMDGFVEAFKTQLTASIVNGALTLGSANETMTEQYFDVPAAE